MEGNNNNSFNLVILLLSAVAVVLTVLIAVLVFQTMQKQPSGEVSEQNTNEEAASSTGVGYQDIGGMLFFTAVDRTSENDNFQAYKLVLEDQVNQIFNHSETLGLISTSFIEYKDQQNPRNYFFKAPVYKLGENSELTDPNNSIFYAEVPTEANEIISDRGQQYGTMAWSNAANALAYATLREQESKDKQANSLVSNWNIMITDDRNENTTKTIEGAAHPAWAPNGNVLTYLKKDGLYAYDFTTEQEKVVIPVRKEGEEGEVAIDTTFDLSPDARYLILTPQKTGQIQFYEIDRTNLTATLRDGVADPGRIYSWPVFAPNGVVYAVLARDLINGVPTNAVIEVRDISNHKLLYSKYLDAFDAQQVFLDDWVNVVK